MIAMKVRDEDFIHLHEGRLGEHKLALCALPTVEQNDLPANLDGGGTTVFVKGADGKTTNWEFELGSPNGLMRQGWTRNSMKIGDTVNVSGYLAKDGSNLANARNVKLADGRKLFAGSTTDGGPTQ